MPKAVRIFLTGSPGSGKSTLLITVIEQLRAEGLKIGGIMTPELRRHGRRVGFKVVDLGSGKEAVLASSEEVSGPQVGRYRVDLHAFEQVALPALETAIGSCDVVAVDEIGRMELLSEPFRDTVKRILDSNSPLIAVVHHDFARTYARHGILITVTPDNRDSLPSAVAQELKRNLESEAS